MTNSHPLYDCFNMNWLRIILYILGGAALIATAVGGGIIISKKINEKRLKKAVKKEFTEAVKMIINDKSTKKVNVGIFDENNDKIKDLTVESEKGVSDELYVGQEIYL